ncbi:hypothetical protein AI3045V2_4797 (plasmid) [Enterobacter cloacae]|nr:hypothetical protein SK56_04606 [Enterobacter sp. MGH128]KUQ20530.1 hypothetical protein AWI07_21915 [Enterobacter roggenkampii]KUR11758.1 hypothetical protein AWI34_14440 [Enterobacter roggenkampii]CAF9618249.1 hypothetical protein AI3045V2_4797 [Enterobacter cloacae]CAH6243058.1 hypothetical protein AI3045V2_4797 [Enterobacter cloacae]
MLNLLIGGKNIILRPKRRWLNARLLAVIVTIVKMLKMDCLDISNYMQQNLPLKMHLRGLLKIKINGSCYGNL